MELPSFTPRRTVEPDRVSGLLYKIASIIIVVSLALWPLSILLAPYITVPSTILVFLGVLGAAGFASLGLLRHGRLTVPTSPLGLAIGLIALLVTGVALYHQQLLSSIFTTSGSVYTSLVWWLGALLVLLAPLYIYLILKKRVLAALLIAVLVWQWVIVLVNLVYSVPAGWLSSTLVGSYTDLSVLVLVSLTGVLLFSHRFGGLKFIAVSIIIVWLLLTALVIFPVWFWYIALVATLAITLLQLLAGRHQVPGFLEQRFSRRSLLLTLGSFVFAVVVLIAGTNTINQVSSTVGVNYLEVRPSVAATATIFEGVYNTNPWLGVGIDRFSEAWDKHRSADTLLTPFWEVSFATGHSFFSTWLILGGVVTTVAVLLLHVAFIYQLWRLSRPVSTEMVYWRRVSIKAAIVATILLVAFWFYVPSMFMLLLFFVAVGVWLTAESMCAGGKNQQFSFTSTTPRTLVAVASTATFIILVVVTLHTGSQVVRAAWLYGEATTAAGGDTAMVRDNLIASFMAFPQANVAADIARFEQSVVVTELQQPTPNPTVITSALTTSLQAANDAIALRPSLALGWQLRGELYLLADALQGSSEDWNRAQADFREAAARNPLNPAYDAAIAERAIGRNDAPLAISAIDAALAKKPNFTRPLELKVALSIGQNDLAAAAEAITRLLQIDPRNPAYYYQAGVVASLDNNPVAAIDLLSLALQLNPQFANALYVRALAHVANNDREAALADINRIIELDANNEADIEQLRSDLSSGVPLDAIGQTVAPTDVLNTEAATSTEAIIESEITEETEATTTAPTAE